MFVVFNLIRYKYEQEVIIDMYQFSPLVVEDAVK